MNVTPMSASAAGSPLLPIPGVVWGRYPRRGDDAPAARPVSGAGLGAWLAGLGLPAGGDRRVAVPPLAPVRAAQLRWLHLDDASWAAHLAVLRATLARDGFDPLPARTEALGCVAAAGLRALGRDPYDVQLAAAALLLGDCFVEMATGEGKTYALGLAAAVAALAGVPVHLITANDYLAARDAATLQPMFRALGLHAGVVLAGQSPADRRVAYGCPVTYGTAREIAFDHLRDLQAERAQPGLLQRRAAAHEGAAAAAAEPLLRGLCMAIVDEADSVLVDEGSMPLLLAEAVDDPQQRAACFQALALARELQPGRDVDIAHLARRVALREAGRRLLAERAAALGGAWLHPQHREDLVAAALEALHLLQRDRDYLVRDGALELLDPITGRPAPGRVWSRGVHTLVELKEGLKPSRATATRAQISPQRFFGRYVRLAGMSGTLDECRAELAALYGRPVQRVAPRRPSQLRRHATRWFADEAARSDAVVQAVRRCHEHGQPVLVGTDSVQASEALAARLAASGLPHRVLNARHDRAEAEIVAAAGQCGAITIATHMAGRGTDIALGPGVAELGGLMVIGCQDNPSARLDRQLVGRAGRQGEPGEAVLMRCLDAPAWAAAPAWLRRSLAAGRRASLADRLAGQLQRRHEARAARQRERLLAQDRRWHT